MLFYILVFCIVTYFFFKRRHSYWTRKGITQIEPKFFFGNIKKVFFKETTINQIIQNVYYEFKKKGVKHGGIYLLYTPVWVPTDRELVKHILIKDYQYFNSHGFFHHDKDPLSQHVFNLEGTPWKEVRSKLTPTFSMAKLKMMFDIVDTIANRIEKKVEKLYETGQPIDIKETAACIALDCIAICFYGIESDCLNDEENDFRKHGEKMFGPRHIKMWLEQMFNWNLLAYLGHRFFPKELDTFFINLAQTTIEYREKHNISRNDYLDLLLQLKNKGKLDDDNNPSQNESKFLTNKEVCANMFVMYAAGFDTISSTVAFLLYELAKNQEIQDKVRTEILKILKNRPDNKILYEDLAEMKYSEMCVLDALRRYSPLSVLPRRCTKTYRIPDTNQIINKGTMVMIPAGDIHTDPEYYPDPLIFNPENFSTERKKTRPECTFMGFGEGPRLCIGNRFAIMQIKIALVKYLSKYRYTLNPKTPMTLSYEPNSITLTAKEDILFDISKID